jgi:hypothetical protein
MKDIILFRFIGNNKKIAHSDLKLEIPILSINKLLDSYWFIENDNFSIPENKRNNFQLRIQHILNEFIRNCISRISSLENGETFAIPIGVWDECTEYLIVEKIDTENLILKYGWSEKGGVNLYSLSQEYFYIDTVKFTNGPKTIKLDHFLNGLKTNILN